jgi:hypothetical protein
MENKALYNIPLPKINLKFLDEEKLLSFMYKEERKISDDSDEEEEELQIIFKEKSLTQK